MKKHKNKIIAGAIIAFALVFVYWWGGDAPGLRGWNPQTEETAVTHISDKELNEDAVSEAAESEKKSEDTVISEEKAVTQKKSVSEEKSTDEKSMQLTGDAYDDMSVTEKASVEPDDEVAVREIGEAATEENRPQKPDKASMTAEEKTSLAERMAQNSSHGAQQGDKEYSQNKGMYIDEKTGLDKYMTDPVPEGRPVPVEPDNAVISDTEYTCTLSVRCDTILSNIAWLDPEKAELVPKDGVIYAEQTVTFYEGESVFNVLVREMKRSKIHMEFVNTPIYNSAYIEGIGNLYEFDCGELSGWMYRVNDWFPNYGCSRYQLKDGDRIEWLYTCDLGIDVGGYYAATGE